MMIHTKEKLHDEKLWNNWSKESQGKLKFYDDQPIKALNSKVFAKALTF